jgi:hypothetical protein
LHHVDEAWLELKLKVVGFECWSSTNFSVLGAENSRRVFTAIASEVGVELPLDLVDSD